LKKQEISSLNVNFEEQSDFEEEFVFNNCYDDTNGLVVNGFSIDYRQNINDVQYLVKSEDAEVASYFRDNVKFGDLLKVGGFVNNRVVYKFVDAETPAEEPKSVVGRKTVSGKQKNNKTREIESEDRSIQIIEIIDIQQGKYTKEDLEVVEEEEKMPWDTEE
jgi:hypothetical protein